MTRGPSKATRSLSEVAIFDSTALSPRAIFRPFGTQSGEPDETSAPPDLILRKQLHVATKVAPLANMASIVNIVAIGIFVIPASLGSFRYWWLAVAVSCAANSTRVWLKRWNVSEADRDLRDYHYLLVEVIAIGVINSALMLLGLPVADHGEALMLVASQVGVIGCGAIALSTIRSIGLSWVLANTFGILIAIGLHPGAEYRVLFVLFFVYVSVVMTGVLFMSWSFKARCIAEFASERQRQSVGLLLDDFEGGSLDWLWETDADGRLTRVSARFAKVAAMSIEELQQLTLAGLLEHLRPVAPGYSTHSELLAALRGQSSFRELTVAVEVRGELRYWSFSGKSWNGGWRGVGSDITAEKLQRDEIVRLANTDSLTGLPNRHYFQGALQSMAADRTDGSALLMAILDLDNFKMVNDTLGHDSGDQLLAQLATRLAGERIGNEVCARLGGDEFAILLPGVTSQAGPARLAEYFQVLREPFALTGALIEIRGCIGFAEMPIDAMSVDGLVTSADLALFAAKDSGGNHIRRFDQSLRDKALSRGVALQELSVAIDRGEFAVYYQPQMSFDGNRLIGFEALARWRHPDRGIVAPGEFIPVAEESGLLVPIGRSILLQSCREARHWPEHISLGINLSPIELKSAGIVATISACLEQTGLPASRLEIEVTESAVVDDLARQSVETLARMGVAVAIDDFGTGYSSFESLRALPVGRVKIDRSFVRTLLDDPSDRSTALLRAMIDMAKALDLDALAEGVETEGQRETLRTLGCDSFQGFLEARPMPADEVDDYLATHDLARN